MSEELTPAQVEHWRKVLFSMVGPYALLMTAEQIQQYRDTFQANINKAIAEESPQPKARP